MKTKAIIITGLIMAQIAAFVLKSNAQERDKCPSAGYYTNSQRFSNGNVSNVKPLPILLADETVLNYCKTEAIIECDNETIFNKIFLSHSQLFKRFTCTWIHRKSNSYKHYVIYIDRGDSQILINWAKTNL